LRCEDRAVKRSTEPVPLRAADSASGGRETQDDNLTSGPLGGTPFWLGGVMRNSSIRAVAYGPAITVLFWQKIYVSLAVVTVFRKHGHLR
jgi:hypothetical protein